MRALFGACLALFSLALAAWGQRAPQPGPDVFLVTIDTLRADHVHCYGYERIATPAIDGLAGNGVRFTSAFTASPITNSSHATILTGDLPSTHGVTDFAIPLQPSTPTWAELLKQAGYQTGAFIAAAILDSNSLAPGFDRGFDFYDNFPRQPATSSRWGRVERRGMVVVQHAERWLDQHPGGRRFLWLHLYDPHDPYDPPAPYAETYKGRLYDGEIAYADAALGDFLAYLKKRGWYDNALVVAVGDHGEGLGEHGEDTHGIFLYDSTLHVPLIIKKPRQQAGTVVNAQVRTIDILPTVIAVLGLSPKSKFDGDSLVPQLDGAPARELPPLVAQTDYPLSFGWAPLRAVRSPGHKFIEAPRPELYELGADPGELRNRYEPWNADVQKSRAILAQVREQHAGTAAPPVGQATLDELRALGYLGPEGATSVPEPSLLPDPKDKVGEQNLLHHAMLAVDDNRTAEARTVLLQVLQSDPKSVPALVQLGKLQLSAARYRDAAEFLKRAQALSPSATTALSLGEALQKLGDLQGARAALESSLRQNPRQPEARILMGNVLLGLKDAPGAEDQFTAVLLVNPQSAAAHLGLGRVRLQQNNARGAIEELKTAARLDRNNREVYEALSQAYERIGEKRLAAEAAERAARLPEARR
jgi:choline-sulfatase